MSILDRRWFLKAFGLVALTLADPRAAWALFLKKFPVRTVERSGWAFSPETGTVREASGTERPYVLTVDGLVDRPVSLSWSEVKQLPLTRQTSDFHCVEGWSVADLHWGGFRFQEIVSLVKPKSEAGYAVFHSLGTTRSTPQGLDHYVESLPLARLVDPTQEILLCWSLDGKPLPQEHGAPLRVISPYDLAYKSIKFVTRIELTDKPRPGWWTAANPIYPIDAPVPASRLRQGRPRP